MEIIRAIQGQQRKHPLSISQVLLGKILLLRPPNRRELGSELHLNRAPVLHGIPILLVKLYIY